jgi:carbon storage regulator CsrA
MLVLSRKREESILIGGDIKIRVIKMRGNAVLLGIEAPPAVTILRSELQEGDELNDGRMTEPQAA